MLLRKLSALIVTIAVTALTIGSTGTDVSAASVVHNNSASSSGKNCVSVAVPKGEAAAPVTCFDTLEQVRQYASAKSGRILAILYEDTNGGDRTFTILENDNNGCSGGIPDLRVVNFNDITSSLQNGCGKLTLYFDPNYSGAREPYYNGFHNVSLSINDETSSVLINY